MSSEDDLTQESENDFGHQPTARAEELAETLDVPIEVAEQIAGEEGNVTDDEAFVDSEWLR